ncbi:putative nitroreductase [Vermiconidia calcicola]|uniref:Nitroreductase n=1 Tax=Vermiconidia calcicola TaxID=1690605 RepID=A0ACC3NIQ7_9PEZI|nr:putative nitroreductase [Vermiconidia calcicola]
MTYDSTSFKDAVKHRRTVYQLTKKSTIPDSRIQEILETAITEVPSSFNSQSARIVVLLKDEHDKFWDIVRDVLKTIVPEDKWEHTGNRIAGFRNAYGTALFYEDPASIRKLQEQYPSYTEKFPQWSEHTSAMHQYMLWTAFETEGLGCNLQHYNPLPDRKVSEIWNVPAEWGLKAQLVFGTPAEGARDSLPEKSQLPIKEKLFVHGAS